MFVRDLGAEGAKGLLVHVRRARAEHAASGQRNLGPAEAPEQGADEVERGRQFANERVRRFVFRDVRRIDRHDPRTVGPQARAERFEQLPHDRNVRDVRNATQRDGRLREQCGRHDRKRGILRPVRLDGAGKLLASVDPERGFEPIEYVHDPNANIRTALAPNPCDRAGGAAPGRPETNRMPFARDSGR